jgi:hypothetical protein
MIRLDRLGGIPAGIALSIAAFSAVYPNSVSGIFLDSSDILKLDISRFAILASCFF